MISEDEGVTEGPHLADFFDLMDECEEAIRNAPQVGSHTPKSVVDAVCDAAEDLPMPDKQQDSASDANADMYGRQNLSEGQRLLQAIECSKGEVHSSNSSPNLTPKKDLNLTSRSLSILCKM